MYADTHTAAYMESCKLQAVTLFNTEKSPYLHSICGAGLLGDDECGDGEDGVIGR